MISKTIRLLLLGFVLVAFQQAGSFSQEAAIDDVPPLVSPADEEILRALDAAEKLLETPGQRSNALRFLQQIASRQTFIDGTAAVRGQVLYRLAKEEFLAGMDDDALRHLQSVGEIAPELRDYPYWFAVSFLAQKSSDVGLQAVALSHITREYPERIYGTTMSEFREFLAAAAALPVEDERILDYMEALREIALDRRYPEGLGEATFLRLVEGYAKSKPEHAMQVAMSFRDPATFVTLLIDRRYEGVWSTELLERFEEVKLSILDQDAEEIVHQPKVVSKLVRLALDLRYAMRVEDALKVVDYALGQIGESDPQLAFDDGPEYVGWLYDTRARLFLDLGQFDDVLDVAVQAAEKGEDKVSHILNLAWMAIRLDRADYALSVLASWDEQSSSPYGRTFGASLSACAYHMIGEDDAALASLNYLRKAKADGLVNLLFALSCMGEEDELAANLIEGLRDPDTRLDVLMSLQRYPELPRTETEAALAQTFELVRERLDVVDEINRVGRVLAWQILPILD